MAKKAPNKPSPVTQAQPETPAPTKASARSLPGTSQGPINSPSREAIAMRAYELYVARGQSSGHEMEDWVQAERELSNRVRKS